MKGIEFEVFWWHQDVIEYLVRCSNGAFAGAAKMYMGHDELSKVATVLGGFPSSNTDSRNIELGTFQRIPQAAGFTCILNAWILSVMPACR